MFFNERLIPKMLATSIALALVAFPASHASAQDSATDGGSGKKTNDANTKQSTGKDGKTTDLDTVEVTGSRLKRSEIEGPQRVNVYSREEIERSGQATIGGFLATLPEVFNGTAGEGADNAYPDSPSVQLHGFPLGSTLVLINGRRPANSAATTGTNFSLQNIPASAIERVEILPEGASAVYGSDALAGVINVILKDDLDGFEINTTYGNAPGAEDAMVNVAWGKQWGTGAISAIASWTHRNALQSRERALTADQDFSRFGGPDLRATTCNPGNVYSVDGSNLPGLNAPYAAIPADASSAGNFAPTAGSLARCTINGAAGLIAGLDQQSLFASFNQQLSGSVELFSTLLYTHADNNQPWQLYSVSKQRVPAINPYNPFGTDVLVDFAFQREYGYSYSTDYIQPLIGLRGNFGKGWDWEVAAWWGRDDRVGSYAHTINTGFLNGLLSQSDPGQSINLFSTGGEIISDELAGQLFPTTRTDYLGETRAANAVVRGSLPGLPAGDISLAVGLEGAKETLVSNQSGSEFNFDYSRESFAGFAEAKIPLLESAGREILGLTGAVRRDEYSDYGGSTTAQYGLEWRPARSLLVRAAYAESFVAPQLYAVNAPQYESPPNSTPRYDPVRNETVFPSYVYGGNPSLKPQNGKSWSLGVVWDSEAAPGLQGSLSLWKLSLSDRFAQYPGTQLLITNEALFPERIIREATTDGSVGRILTVDYSALNLGELNAQGVDFDLGYSKNFTSGKLTSGLSATWIDEFAVAVVSTQPSIDYVGISNSDVWAPRLRLTARAGWETQLTSTSLIGRYTSAYEDRSALPDGVKQTLGDFWTLDASVALRLGAWLFPENHYLNASKVTLGVVNLLDKEVPYSTSGSYGYDSSVYNIRGRYIFLSLGTHW